MESSFDSIRSPMGNARIDAGNDTDTETCLTSIGIAESPSTGGIVNVELYYNTEIPSTGSSTCETSRSRTPQEFEYNEDITEVVNTIAGLLIAAIIISICSCIGFCVCIWYCCCKKKGTAVTKDVENQRPSTPEKQNPQTVNTTTIIQQPAMM